MIHEINDRIQVDGKICTIRFVGEIHRWPGCLTYGVEWDDPERGKNSGTIDSREYFKTAVPNSGSFFKDSKLSILLDPKVSFYEALREKYGRSHNEIKEIYLGTKKVESFGFEKLTVDEKSFGKLQKICLDHSRIGCFTTDSNIALESYSGILELDLSYNLLADIKDVFEFITYFPHLKSLDLSGNYFTKGWTGLDRYSFPCIKTLHLSNCRLELYQLKKLLTIFPSLEILNVGKNFLEDIGNEEILLPDSTKELILSDNSIRNFPIGLPRWKNLHTLNISHNNIVTISNIVPNGLKNLDLSFNLVENWQVIDLINCAFPGLHSFRFNGNPLFDNAEDPLAQFYVMIGRFNYLHILNGSILSKKDREEGKLFFVSQVSRGLLDYDKTSELWQRLSSRYAINCPQVCSEKSWLGSQILSLKIKQEKGQITDLTILSSYSVRNLKRIICEQLSMHIYDVSLSYFVSPSVQKKVEQDFIPVSDLGIANGDFLYVEKKGH